MDIVLLGMQGAGKGTQARQLVEKFNVPLFETGAALRKLAQEESELGQKIKSIIEAGRLVPNEVVMEIIEDFLKDIAPDTSVIFDGIPRSLDQAAMFDGLMKKHGRTYGCAIINLSEETALKRLTSRKMCKMPNGTKQPARLDDETGKWILPNGDECTGELETRNDDKPEAIQTRIDTFKKETLPVLEKYKEEGIAILELNGELTVEKATKEAFEKLGSHL